MTRLLWVLILTPVALVLICPCDRTRMSDLRLEFSADPEQDLFLGALEVRDAMTVRRLLRDGGVDLTSPDRNGQTPLGRTAHRGWLEGCRMLLDARADPNLADALHQDPLHYAVVMHDSEAAEVVDLLIRRGADVNARGHRGNPVLNYAVMFGPPETVRRLIRAGAQVNAASADGSTPLHEAVSCESVEKTSMLLQAGANPRAKDNAGRTPLDIARESGSAEIQALLRQ